MVKLRLRRKGRAHHPVYDIVAVDSRKKRDADYLERLGFYDPHTKPSTVKVDSDRVIYWLNVGAQPTDVVRSIFQFEGVLLKRAMQFKNKPEVEITEMVEKHKKDAEARYFRLKDLRVKRKENKLIAEATAKKAAEEAAKVAETAAE
jgi:small subunit ribosomal protein S16